jgi:hypothetical protein
MCVHLFIAPKLNLDHLIIYWLNYQLSYKFKLIIKKLKLIKKNDEFNYLNFLITPEIVGLFISFCRKRKKKKKKKNHNG